MRVGIGFDIHRLVPDPKRSGLPLGGIRISSQFSVVAHSDGDVLLHALVDACLGALALGDIGQWFPESDPANQNRASSDFVTSVGAVLREKGWKVRQIDSVVFVEKPRLAEHIPAIRKSIAKMLDLEPELVGVKAKTMEGLGPIGEGKGIAAQVIVMLEANHAESHQ